MFGFLLEKHSETDFIGFLLIFEGTALAEMRVDGLEKLKQIAIDLFFLISKSLVIITILFAFLVVFQQQLLVSGLILFEKFHPIG